MKKLVTLILALILTLSCFSGCSKEENNDDSYLNNEDGNTSQLNESEFSDSSDSETEVSLREGEFDPLSIVKDEYITYDKTTSGHYYNGGGNVKISFPEDFEVEIIPGLYLRRMVRDSISTIYSSSLDVIANNQLLGSIEFYFVGETLKYNNIAKLTEGDVIKLLFTESDESSGLEDNLAANGFSMVEIPMYVTVPDLGDLFTVEDEITSADIQYIISSADPTKCNSAFETSTYSERPVAIYKGTINSKTAVGDAVVLQLIYEKTEKYGTGTITKLVSFPTSGLTKHDGASATCAFSYGHALRFNNDVSETEMFSHWDKDYTWEKLDY